MTWILSQLGLVALGLASFYLISKSGWILLDAVLINGHCYLNIHHHHSVTLGWNISLFQRVKSRAWVILRWSTPLTTRETAPSTRHVWCKLGFSDLKHHSGQTVIAVVILNPDHLDQRRHHWWSSNWEHHSGEAGISCARQGIDRLGKVGLSDGNCDSFWQNPAFPGTLHCSGQQRKKPA